MKFFSIILFFVCLPWLSFSQKDWYINFSPGYSYVPPSPLTINQSGYPKVFVWAKYKTEPFKFPIYYSYRLGFRNYEQWWELEMNHLKIYLKNKPKEVQRFNVTHGFNQLIANKIYNNLKFGLGMVLAHPENTVRNFQLNEKKGIFNSGYYLAGPVIQIGYYKEFDLTERFYFFVETKVSVAYANVPVVSGRAHVPVAGIHLQLGPGYFFIKN